jgi:SAM-dependent methyltransferase
MTAWRLIARLSMSFEPIFCEAPMTVMTERTASGEYILGHANKELERLISQSRFIGELTEHLLRLAGLQTGLHVLDVGCGGGDVSFLAARIVGPTGTVTGIDRSPESVALASRRAAAAGLANVRFLTADARDFVLDEPVDALIGRLVLMYWPEAASAVQHLARSVKPGGIITFQDYDLAASKSEPWCPQFETALNRLRQTFTLAGAETRMGLKLGRVFEDAGLPTPTMLMAARVERGPEAEAYHQVTEITRTLLPLMERTGVATSDVVDIDTMARRLKEEALALRATLVAPSLVGAWSRKPY